MRALSGIQPSGRLHIGNYFGALRQHLALMHDDANETYYFMATYHALTTTRDPNELRQLTLDVAIDYLALGLDPKKSILFRQQDVPEVTELTWILSCVCPMGLLERATSYKDKVAQGLMANHGLFAYPVLQAADILIYHPHVVPVGQDQKQHIEITRDLAIKFNNEFGEVFRVPDAYIIESTAVVPGVDGRKMSKSYGNTIGMFETGKALRKKVMAIVTDSTPVEDPKDPETSTPFLLLKLMATRRRDGRLGRALPGWWNGVRRGEAAPVRAHRGDVRTLPRTAAGAGERPRVRRGRAGRRRPARARHGA